MDFSCNKINSNKELISSIMAIKRSIAEIVRDRIYIKDFSSRLIEYLYELDDMSSRITVDILQKTDLHKCLKPMLGFSDAHFEVKDVCNKVLYSIFENMKQELFEDKMTDDKIIEFNVENQIPCDVDNLKREIEEELMKNITTKTHLSIEEDDEIFDESIIRTDTKYLNFIKKIELHMLLESKRRTKTKRMECEKKLGLEINEKSEGNISTNQNLKISNNAKIMLNNSSGSPQKKTASPNNKYFERERINHHHHHLKKENKNHNSMQEAQADILAKKLNDLVKSDKKLLRSLAPKNINKFYELSQNSEYVNKPIKSQRKRNRANGHYFPT